MTNRRVLLVEDEKQILDAFATTIRDQGYEVFTAENGEEAMKIFQGITILVVVTDLMMPGKGGLDVLKDIKRQQPQTRVIIMTGLGGGDHAIQAVNSQAFRYIEKGKSGAGNKLLQAIEKAFADAETQIRVEREMLAFLTHTLFGSISGGPETVNQVLESAQSTLGDRYGETVIYQMINNIASLKAVFQSIARMLEAYRIFVNEPETFRQKWREEEPGDVSLSELFSVVLRQSLGSILFEETNLKPLNRILAAYGVVAASSTREAFLKEVFWSEEVSRDLKRVVNWIEQTLPVATVEIESSGPCLDPGGVRYAFLFAILSEIVYNALKYTDCREPIRIEWKRDGDKYRFSCRNTFSLESTRRRDSQKGLAFVGGLTQMIEGISLRRKSEPDVFTVELFLNGSTLEGGVV
jgi:DNA-binding response OmpR family regulator